MPAPLSLDLRRRIIKAYTDGEGTYEELAARFAVGRATVDRYLRLARETGSVAAKLTGGSKSILDDEDMESIHLIVFEQPDITLAELRVRFIGEGGSSTVGTSTLWRAIDRLGMTRKKKRSSTIAVSTRM